MVSDAFLYNIKKIDLYQSLFEMIAETKKKKGQMFQWFTVKLWPVKQAQSQKENWILLKEKSMPDNSVSSSGWGNTKSHQRIKKVPNYAHIKKHTYM